MEVISGNIIDVKKGIIMQQVNCQNVMGSGVAAAIYNEYPFVKNMFHSYSETIPMNKRLGRFQIVHLDPELIIVNSFSQFYYGRDPSYLYTDYESLFENLKRLNKLSTHEKIKAYIPYKIGCGLANGDWEKVENFIDENNLNNIIAIKL